MRLTTLKPRIATTANNRLPTLVSGSWRTDRMTTAERGYDYRWQKARERFLRAHPLCQCPDCDDGRKRVTAASVIDHHIPHRGDPVKFWDETNWRAMAKPCHDRKTAAGG